LYVCICDAGWICIPVSLSS